MKKIHLILLLMMFGPIHGFSPLYAATLDPSSVVAEGDVSSFMFTSFSTVSPNNDNSIVGGNPISIGGSIDSISPIDIIFLATDTAGITEYYSTIFHPEVPLASRPLFDIENNTGIPWIGFELMLGYKNPLNGSFQLSTTSDGLDFDAPDRDPPALNYSNPMAPLASIFPLFNHGPNLLTWAGGVLNPGESLFFDYSFDLPDFNGFTPDFARTSAGYQFALRYNPIRDPSFIPPPPSVAATPEPSTILLFGIGLFVFPFVSKKFSRK